MHTGVMGLENTPVCLSGAKERRLIHRFLYHWIALCQEQELPSIDDLSIANLPAPWEQCFLLTRTEPWQTREFDHLGEVFHTDHVSPDRNRVDAIRPQSLLDYVTRPISLAIADRIPMITSGSIVSTNRRHLKFRSIILPFAGRASGNLYLLGAANWREDAFGLAPNMEDFACYKFVGGEWRPAYPLEG
jgi:hypothetical protein